jgi:hypothetical protein
VSAVRPERSETITARTLGGIRHETLRADAEAALGRGEAVRLLRGGAGGAVETLVLASGRAAQSGGSHVIRGVWSGERLLTDAGGHALGTDGGCFCRDCEMALGHCVDDDE